MESRYPCVLDPTEQDVLLMLSAQCHLGTQNLNNRMKPYIFSRRPDGVHLFHLGKTWEKLMLAARILVTLPPESIYVTSSTVKGRRPAIKLAHYLGGQSNQGRFVPGTFTNRLEEPSALVSMDPMTDFQAIKETGYCNMPVIALCNSYTSLRSVDVAIPCNNQGTQSIGLICWFLARAVIRLRGQLDYETPWAVIPDMFFYTEQLIASEEVTEAIPQFSDFQQQNDWSNQDETQFYFSGQQQQQQQNEWSNQDQSTQIDWESASVGHWHHPTTQIEEQEVNFYGPPTDKMPSLPDIESNSASNWADDIPPTQVSEGWGTPSNKTSSW
ncbi:40S ribosomal protein S0-A [Choanephora cucurbitarum]|uniref:Small ribosomal subunit protein uS2 n=1 Tax=Choanephora cucurbitarum TaxID=101091 RepID=A0A1C7NH10_9FUNG|nr:40S ribosomal protein S0-A [Choanephora cucurbitarum]